MGLTKSGQAATASKHALMASQLQLLNVWGMTMTLTEFAKKQKHQVEFTDKVHQLHHSQSSAPHADGHCGQGLLGLHFAPTKGQCSIAVCSQQRRHTATVCFSSGPNSWVNVTSFLLHCHFHQNCSPGCCCCFATEFSTVLCQLKALPCSAKEEWAKKRFELW